MISEEDVNQKYYSQSMPGRLDYWKKMAAPQFRIKTILSQLQTIPFRSVVDLGCGSGLLLREIEKNFENKIFCGLDLSEQQIKTNQLENPSTQWIHFNLEQSEELASELHAQFDLALCSEVIEHLQKPDRLLAHAKKITRPGGILIITTQSGPIRETEQRVGHYQHFSKQSMETLLTSNAWHPLKIWNAGYPFHDLSKWMANWNAEKTMRQFSDSSYGPWQNIVAYTLRFLFQFNSTSKGAQLFAIARNN